MCRLLLTTTCALILSAGAAFGAEPDATSISFFEKKIRPVLIERCVDCHSGDEPESGLRVNSLAGLIRGGTRGTSVVIGKPEESLLIRAIRHGELVKMPPKKKLPAAQIADFVQWIQQGAVWPNEKPPEVVAKPSANAEPVWSDEQKSFWSFQPPVAAPLPEVKNHDWLQNPIDAFVLARLEAAGLAPAPQADKRALIRRATFDLLGLPPTPAEVEEFLADDSPGAFARVVDRLLASPHYGQRWGRHWLDVARYADSNGLDENLAYANAYRYRDYVVQAINNDLPYDQFVREQIAGDLLAQQVARRSAGGKPNDNQPARSPASPKKPGFSSSEFDQITATGFLSLGAKMLAEDDPVKMQMDIIDEQIDTVGRAFMGMTMGCARCHDHKFDPISSHDYYGLAGIFKSTKTMENFNVVARWQEVPLATPEEVWRRFDLAEGIDQKIHMAKTAGDELVGHQIQLILLEARRHVGDYLLAALRQDRIDRELATAQPRADQPDAATQSDLQVIEAEDFARGNVQKNFDSYGAGIGVLVNQGQLPNFVEYDVEISANGLYQFDLRYAAAAARPCKLFINGELVKTDAAGKVTGSWNTDGQKWAVEGIFPFGKGKNVVRLEHAKFFPHIDKLLIAAVPDKVADAVVEPLDKEYRPLPQFVSYWIEFLAKPALDMEGIFDEWRHRTAASTLDKAAIRKLACEIEQKYPQENDELDSSAEPFRKLLYTQQGMFGSKPPRGGGLEKRFPPKVRQQLARLREKVAKLEKMKLPELPSAMAVSDEKPQDVRIHIRGSHLTLGTTVERRMPTVMTHGEQSSIGDDSSGRLQLAEWLTNPQHPLTARVMVNRIWQWHFGEGLVRSPDNFGRLGQRPTHPELLDWLAVEFVKSGWSLKAMHRLILLSSSWQQSTHADPATIERDPENRLLSRMNRRRLEAEEVRDSLLVVAGALDESMGGTKLPTKNRAYVTSTANVNPVVYESDRRSIYLPVVRSALYEVFQAFDFADPSVSSGQRQSTTVAPQALFMMNSKFVAEQAERMAERLLIDEPSDNETRIARAWMLAYSRQPSREEVSRSLQYVDVYSRRYASAFPDRSDTETRAWQSLCRAVLAANEFLFVE